MGEHRLSPLQVSREISATSVEICVIGEISSWYEAQKDHRRPHFQLNHLT
jgi:hypothetical protein